MAPTLGEVGAFAFLVRTTCGSGWFYRRFTGNHQPPATAGGSDLFALSSFLAIIALSAFKTTR